MTRDDRLREIGRHLHHDGPAKPADVARLAETLGPLPASYVGFVSEFDGAEGWIGDEYISLWPAADIHRYNSELSVARIAPGLVLFGTNGGGEAFGFDTRDPNLPIVMVPLIGLEWDAAILEARSFGDWLLRHSERPPFSGPDVFQRKMNLYEVHPVRLGGSPTDPANKRLVTLSDLVSIARWWNDRLRPS